MKLDPKAWILNLYRFVVFALRRWTEDRCPQMAGSLAFTTLLAMVPMFALVVAALSRTPWFEDLLIQIKVFLLLNLVPEIAHKVITVYMEEFASNAFRLTGLGLAVVFVTAIATMLMVDRQIHAIWREPPTRKLWVAMLAYATLLFVGPLLIAISVSLTTYLMSLSTEVDAPEGAHAFMLQAAPTVVSMGAFFLLYKLVPHTYVRSWHALLGALVASLLFEWAKDLFAFYVANMRTYNVVYGTFVTVPFFLIWIYVSWLVVLFGAELTAALGHWPPKKSERLRTIEDG
jgi:membrane protein